MKMVQNWVWPVMLGVVAAVLESLRGGGESEPFDAYEAGE